MVEYRTDGDIDLNKPMQWPPKGVEANFEHPPNNNAFALGILALCLVIATIGFLSRVYQRVIKERKIDMIEVLTFMAYGCFIGAWFAAYKLSESPGYYVHGWNVRLREDITIGYWGHIMANLYTIDMPLVKTAILVEWCRMFVTPRAGASRKGWFWWSATTIMTTQNTAALVFVVLLNIRCIPYEANYEYPWFVHGAKCKYELTALYMTSGIIQILSDVAMFLLPQPIIWRLKLDWLKKLGVSIIFGFGLCACISAAFRMVATVRYTKSNDHVYHLAPIVLWLIAEQACGFFIIGVPCISKLLKESGVFRPCRRCVGVRSSMKRSKSTGHPSATENSSSYMELS